MTKKEMLTKENEELDKEIDLMFTALEEPHKIVDLTEFEQKLDELLNRQIDIQVELYRELV